MAIATHSVCITCSTRLIYITPPTCLLPDPAPRASFMPQALQPPEEAPAMPLMNEVAVSVFGRDLLEGRECRRRTARCVWRACLSACG